MGSVQKTKLGIKIRTLIPGRRAVSCRTKCPKVAHFVFCWCSRIGLFEHCQNVPALCLTHRDPSRLLTVTRQYGVKLPHFSFPSSFTCFPRHLCVMPLLFFDSTPVVVCALWYMSVRFFLLFARVCVCARGAGLRFGCFVVRGMY